MRVPLILCGVVFLSLSAGAKPLPATLSQTVALAHQNSLKVEARDAQRRAGDEALDYAGRQWLPETTLTARAQANFIDQKGRVARQEPFEPVRMRDLNTKTQNNLARIGIAMRQNLFNGGGTTALIERESAALDVSTIDLKMQRQEVIMEAVQIYVSVYVTRQLVQNAEHNVSFYEKQLEVAELKFEVGEETVAQVASMRAKLEEARANLIEVRSQLAVSEAAFVRITGMLPPAEFAEPTVPTHLPETLSEFIEKVLGKSLNIHRADSLVDVESAKVDMEVAGMMPSIDLEVGLDRVLNSSKADSFGEHNRTRDKQLTLAATLRVPLDFRGVHQAGIRARKYQAAAVKLQAKQARREQVLEAIKLWEQLLRTKAMLKKHEAQLDAAKLARNNIQEEYAVGAASYLGVIEAEQLYLNANNKVVSTKGEYLITTYNALAAFGSLTLEAFGLMDVAPNEDFTFWGTDIETPEVLKTAHDPILGAYKTFEQAVAANAVTVASEPVPTTMKEA